MPTAELSFVKNRQASDSQIVSSFPFGNALARATDTVSKVIPKRCKGHPKAPSSAPIGNNFAARENRVVKKSAARDNRGGGNAKSRTQSQATVSTRNEWRPLTGSSAHVQKSERTASHEVHCISSTGDKAKALRRKVTPRKKPMKAWQELTHFAGFDWAKGHHDVVIVDKGGSIVAEFQFTHDAPGWEQFRKKVASFEALGIVIETSTGFAVEQLLNVANCTVFPVTPRSAKSYRERKAPSGAKSDHLDAWSLADALRTDGRDWKSLSLLDPIIQELRVLCRDEEALIEERTALVNQIQQAIYEYYPIALKAFDDWTMPSVWAFVIAFPTPEALKKAGKRKWENFLHSHRLWRSNTAPERLAWFAKATEFHASDAVTRAKSRLALTRAKQLQTLETQLELYRKAIEELFSKHPDHNLFDSLPGVGPKLGPRLLSEIGDDRALFGDAESLQCVAGTAPVTKKSGATRIVKIRWCCNKNLRHAVHLWANSSLNFCAWARVYYEALKKRGMTHAKALRNLGQRWLKILWKMWQTSTCYDPEFHAMNQLKHGSWVLSIDPK